jgi:hypothetical protein
MRVPFPHASERIHIANSETAPNRPQQVPRCDPEGRSVLREPRALGSPVYRRCAVFKPPSAGQPAAHPALAGVCTRA